MRLKLFTRLMTLALVLMMILSVPALAASCALCGKDSGSDAYLCAACLLGLLEEKDLSGGLEITGAVEEADGTVTLCWHDEANSGPYTVYYELLEAAPVPFGWTASEGVHATSLNLDRLVPGVSYRLTVKDASGNTAEYTYFAKQPGEAERIGTKIRFKNMRYIYKNYVSGPWEASEIMRKNGVLHGLYLRLNYSMLKKTRDYAFCVAVEAPNGFADVILSGNLTMGHGKSQMPVWSFIDMEDYFSILERYYGGVPTGEYTVTMYFDGSVAASESFTMK